MGYDKETRRANVEKFDLEKEHDKKIRDDVIEFVVDKIIFPLLNEYDIGMWENIDYIELAEKWVEFVNARKGEDDDIANDLKNWIRICYSRNSMK